MEFNRPTRIPELAAIALAMGASADATPEDLAEGGTTVPPVDEVVEQPKELYVSVAAIPGLAPRSAVASALACTCAWS